MSTSVDTPEKLVHESAIEPLSEQVLAGNADTTQERIFKPQAGLPNLTSTADEIRASQTDPLQELVRPRKLTKSLLVRSASKLSIAAVGIEVGAYGGSIMGLSGFIGTMLTTGTCTIVAPIVRKKYERRKHSKTAEQIHSIQAEVHLPVEAYFNSDQEGVELRMFADDAPISTHTLLQELMLLRRAVRAADATSVTLPLARVREFINDGGNPEDVGYSIKTDRQWLFEKSTTWGQKLGIVLEDNSSISGPNDEPIHTDEQMLINLTSEELEKLYENVNQEAAFEPLSSIIRILTKVAPDHPLVAQYALLRKSDAQPRDAFRRTIDYVTSRRLDDVTASRSEVAPGVLVKLKQSIAGKLEVGRFGQPEITWRTPNLQVADSAELFDHIRMTPEMLTALLRHPEIAPASKIVEICEIAIWLSEYTDFSFSDLADSASNSKAAPTMEPYMPFTHPGKQERVLAYCHGVNDKLGKEIASSRATKIIRTARTSLAFLLIAAGSTIGADRIDDAASQIHMRPSDYSSDERMIGNATYSVLEGINETWNGFWFDTAAKLGIDPYMFGKARVDDDSESALDIFDSSFSSTVSSVGNAPDRTNKPEFWIKSHGSMKSDGYWAQSVMDSLDGGNGYSLSWHMGVAGDGNQIVAHETSLPGGKKISSSRQAYLEVSSRHFGENDRIIDPQGNTDYGRVFHVPVLEGTRIVAAELKDHPDARLTLQILDTGIQQIVISSDMLGEKSSGNQILTYWLVPDENAPTIHQESHIELAHTPLTDEKIKQIWHTVDLLPTDEAADIEKQAEILQGQFKYSLNPIQHTGTLEGSYQKYLQDVLASRSANCNVASTALAIGNPSETVPVTGFYNTNNQKQVQENTAVLSTTEAHMWNTTPSGALIDATPQSGGNSSLNSEEDLGTMTIDDTEQSRDQRILTIGTSGLLLGLAVSGALLFQEEIRRGNRRAVKAMRRSRQARTRTSTMDAAYGAVNHAFYAAPADKFNPRSEIHSGHGKTGMQSLAQNLQQQGRSSVTVTTSDKRLKRNIKRANRIIRRLQSI